MGGGRKRERGDGLLLEGPLLSERKKGWGFEREGGEGYFK